MSEVLVDSGAFTDLPVSLLERAVLGTLAAEGVADAEISLTLLDDPAISALNRDHLGHDDPTDVLAFALWEPGEMVVGDVYVGVEQARRQAEELGIDALQEVVRLAVHGTLHVLGHDHPDDADAREASPMYRLQEQIVVRVLGTLP